MKGYLLMDTNLPSELCKDKTPFQTTAQGPAYIPDGLGGSPRQYLASRGLNAVRAGDDFIRAAPLVFFKSDTIAEKVVSGMAMATIGLLPR